MQSLVINQELVSKLDQIFGSNNFSDFDSELSNLSALCLHQYMCKSSHDITHYVWSNHVSWGFEAGWAFESSISEQEKETYIKSGFIFDGIPLNFDPNQKLKDISLWAPQDRM